MVRLEAPGVGYSESPVFELHNVVSHYGFTWGHSAVEEAISFILKNIVLVDKVKIAYSRICRSFLTSYLFCLYFNQVST